MILPRKLIQWLQLEWEFIYNGYTKLFPKRNTLSVNLFVDISAYSYPDKLSFRVKNRILALFSWVLSCFLGYLLNDVLVFQEEEIQTILLIQKAMAFGFLISGLLAFCFITLLFPVKSGWPILNTLESRLYHSGIISLVAGGLFIILCLLKFISLIYLPQAYQFYVRIGPVTLYLVQGMFFVGISLCMGIILDLVLKMGILLDDQTPSKNF